MIQKSSHSFMHRAASVKVGSSSSFAAQVANGSFGMDRHLLRSSLTTAARTKGDIAAPAQMTAFRAL
jgi:hypothetical protein